MTSRWRVETTEQFDREYKKLDRAVQRRVMAYLEEVETLDEPRQRGKGLTASHAGVWRTEWVITASSPRSLPPPSPYWRFALVTVAMCTDSPVKIVGRYLAPRSGWRPELVARTHRHGARQPALALPVGRPRRSRRPYGYLLSSARPRPDGSQGLSVTASASATRTEP